MIFDTGSRVKLRQTAMCPNACKNCQCNQDDEGLFPNVPGTVEEIHPPVHEDEDFIVGVLFENETELFFCQSSSLENCE